MAESEKGADVVNEVLIGLDAVDATSTNRMIRVTMEEKRKSRTGLEMLEGEKDGGELSGIVSACVKVCADALSNGRRSAGHVDNDKRTTGDATTRVAAATAAAVGPHVRDDRRRSVAAGRNGARNVWETEVTGGSSEAVGEA